MVASIPLNGCGDDYRYQPPMPSRNGELCQRGVYQEVKIDGEIWYKDEYNTPQREQKFDYGLIKCEIIDWEHSVELEWQCGCDYRAISE